MSSPLNPPIDKLEITSDSDYGSECAPGSSGSSRSGVSDTSTLMYSQEPYETYRSKVLQLCHDIWPTLYQEYSLERMKGGGYNRIIGLDGFGTDPLSPTRLVLRVPRFDDERVDREVATLNFICQQTTVPVPKVIAFDTTINNALNSSYMIQNRIPGVNLALAYPDLSHQQKCSLAAQWGRLLLDLHSVSSPVAGLIESSDESTYDKDFRVVPFDITDFSGTAPSANCLSADVPGSDTVLGILELQFDRWKARALSLDRGENYSFDLINSLLTVAREMHDMRYFDDNRNVLCHLDLEPRNVILSLEQEVSISGILDWDSAVFAPIFMTCAPPFWLWGCWDDDEDEDEKKANDPPPTPELQEIKQTFEDVVGAKVLNYIYNAQYRLARKLFQFALDGINSNESYKDCLELMREWAELKTQNESTCGSTDKETVGTVDTEIFRP